MHLTYAGLRVVANPNMTIVVEDWSRVRSPSRAKRRMKRGFAQNVVRRVEPDPTVVKMGNTLVMHPDTMRALRAKLQNDPTASKNWERY